MKVGDYVRLDRCQGINKIEEYDEDIKKYKLEDVIGDEWGDETFILDENDVIKSSPNIIDLIEIGDYVNGGKVIRLFNPTFLSMGELPYVITDKNKYELQEIENVVTKEQLSSMEYKVN